VKHEYRKESLREQIERNKLNASTPDGLPDTLLIHPNLFDELMNEIDYPCWAQSVFHFIPRGKYDQITYEGMDIIFVDKDSWKNKYSFARLA